MFLANYGTDLGVFDGRDQFPGLFGCWLLPFCQTLPRTLSAPHGTRESRVPEKVTDGPVWTLWPKTHEGLVQRRLKSEVVLILTIHLVTGATLVVTSALLVVTKKLLI